MTPGCARRMECALATRVQLSSALAVRHAGESCTAFAAFDRLLRRPAAAEGFDLVPPSLGE
jgi:hypothetical protein